MTRPRSGTAAAALLTAVILTGCHGNSTLGTPSTASASATASTATLTTAVCHTYPRGGQRLGITIPPGFVIEEPPKSAADLARDQRVNLVMRSRLFGGNGQLPDVDLTTFAYGHGERRDKDALVMSLVMALREAGGLTPTSTPITVTTIAGMPALTGNITDDSALNNADQSGNSIVRYWEFTVSDAHYVLVLITRTPGQDKQYAEELISGLHPGGCP
jgi:hypothetical protein